MFRALKRNPAAERPLRCEVIKAPSRRAAAGAAAESAAIVRLGPTHAFTFASTPRMPDGFTIRTTISRMKA